jgi:hypothetical protein
MTAAWPDFQHDPITREMFLERPLALAPSC